MRTASPLAVLVWLIVFLVLVYVVLHLVSVL